MTRPPEAVTAYEFTIPGLQLINPTNGAARSEHWRARSKRRNQEREATYYAFFAERWRCDPLPLSPYRVTITRRGPNKRLLDDDGLAASAKTVRDAIAALLGVDDGDTNRIRFDYAQEYDRAGYSVRVRVEGNRPRIDGDEAKPAERP